MAIFATNRKLFWIANAALGAGALGLTQCDRYPSYEETLARFRVSATTYQHDQRSLADTVLAHVPRGSSASRVIDFLDSVGYVRGEDFDRRGSYYTSAGWLVPFPTDGAPGPELFIYTLAPYHEPYFSVDRFVCDQAALRLSFRFDETGHLADVESTTGVGCI